jgi:hypothetical protein
MNPKASLDLKILNRMAHSLAEVQDIKDVKAVRDKAEAARTFAKSAALGLKIQNVAAELKLRAERRAGELLADLRLRGGDRKSNRHDDGLKLADLGIEENQSTRWQREAAVPEAIFEQYIAAANKLGQDITAQGLLRLERVINRHQIAAEPKKTQSANGDDRRISRDTRIGTADEVASRRAVYGADERREPVREALEEMKNHRHLLAEILGPYCAAESASLSRSERRLIARLLQEMEALQSCLEQAWFGPDS